MVAPDRFWTVAFEVDGALQRARRRAQSWVGLAAPPRLIPYRGFGTKGAARVLARALEDWGQPAPNLERGLAGSVIASLQRFATAELPALPVSVRWGPRDVVHPTDEEGFVTVDLEPPPTAGFGWNSVEFAVPGQGVSAHGEVLLVDTPERLVISDLDDTVIETGVSLRRRRAEALFFGELRRRRVFPGARELYRGLATPVRGSQSQANPVFYVSSSPWNLYDHLEHLLEIEGLPKGPILLRDWGLHRGGFAPDGRHGHKLERITEILRTIPTPPVLLVGDSSQEDAVQYLEAARRFPGRVAGVLIRRVRSKPGRLMQVARAAEELKSLGVELLFFETSDEALELALDRGWAAR